MKRNRILAITLAGLMAAGSGAVYAFGGCDGGGPHGRDGFGFGALGAAYRVDDLTAEQRQKLDALRDTQRKQMEQTRSDRQALRDAMDKSTDAKTLRPLAEKQGKAVTEMIMRQAELRTEVEKILTPAQRAQLDELRKKRAEYRDERRQGPRW